MTESASVILGDEYDEVLRKVLKEVLADLKADGEVGSWAVGGSQELARTEVSVEGERLVIESETYVGLTISGSRTLTDRVKALVEKKLAIGAKS